VLRYLLYDMSDPFDDLRRYAADLYSEVSPVAAHRAVASAMSHRRNRPRKSVVILVATGMFALTNVALAAVADPAVPGDRLYPVDRAYESVADLLGGGGPRVTERFQEVDVLLERGHLGMALELVQETLTKILESDDPHAALEELDASVGGVPAEVAALVEVARAVGHDDEVSGADVAAIARTLVERIERRPDHAGPGQPTPGVTAPGRDNQTPGVTAPGQDNPNRGGNQP
jgi:hypothetical protein